MRLPILAALAALALPATDRGEVTFYSKVR
jgi:hypothetical protein